MRRFSKSQEESIEAKIELFSPILKKDISQEELMRRIKEIEDEITKKRLKWYEKHQNELDYLKLEELTDLQKAFAMLFGHQMEIDRKNLKIFPVYYEEEGIFTAFIQARNFCPYLEAFKRMEIKSENSVKLCELALEKPCQALVEKVNPKIKFFRNYSHIRPLKNYCDERLLIRDYSLSQQLKDKQESYLTLFDSGDFAVHV